MDNQNNENRDNDITAKKLYSDGTVGYESFTPPLWYVKSRNTINYILGVIEALLTLRFILKLLGANPGSGFVSFLYSITGIFTAPFSGIFNSYATNGQVAKFVFEPATLIAMVVYALAAWGLIGLLKIKVSRE